MKLLIVLLLAMPLLAQIRFLPDKKLWILETERSSYVLGINEENVLQNVYWGNRLLRDDDLRPAHTAPEHASFDSRQTMTNEEFPGWGGLRFNEPCVKATLADGTRDLVLTYASHEIRGDVLEIHTKDIRYALQVDLVYRVYPRLGVIEKHSVIRNQTSQPVVVESAQSGVWYVPPGEGYRLSYMTGRWAGETQLHREPVEPGKKVIESRRGNTSHQANPWFTLDYRGEADEEHGRVWFGAIGWSGNWKLAVEQTPAFQVRVTGGLNDFDFGYLLKPGESLETPAFYGGFTDRGFGESSRMLHAFQREEILPDHAAPHTRPVLYNSWEATTFNVNEAPERACR